MRTRQDNYPEQLGGAYLVNAPWIFSTIWSAVSVFLDKRTRSKVQVLSAGAKQKKALLEVIDADTLPEYLGGTCKCKGGCLSGEGCTHPEGKTIHHIAMEEDLAKVVSGEVVLP
uniref:CRAL-TRIO domain-containing protein n=1 Tax=Pyramimonas obovata TaxID=1411642 RepID=A0A7S0WUC2_9CHLO